MKKEERGEGLEDAPRCGRPPKLNSREVGSLVKNLNQDRSQSSAELLSTSFGTSKQLTSRSIRNYLAKRGFRKCRAGNYYPLIDLLPATAEAIPLGPLAHALQRQENGV